MLSNQPISSSYPTRRVVQDGEGPGARLFGGGNQGEGEEADGARRAETHELLSITLILLPNNRPFTRAVDRRASVLMDDTRR